MTQSGIDAGVQIPPDSTGKIVRTVEITGYFNGQLQTVEMQVIAIADEHGRQFSFQPQIETLVDMLQEMRMQTVLLLRVQEALTHEPMKRTELLELLTNESTEEETLL